MAQIRKYAFDTEFAPDGAIVRDGVTGARNRLTPQEVEIERASAYQTGQRDAQISAERALAEATGALVDSAHRILVRLDAESARLRTEAAHVALAAARKLAGEALDQFGIARVEAAIDAALHALPHGPRLVIRVAPALVEPLRARIEALAAEHAHDGALLVRADEAAAPGDVSIDWADGVVTLSRADIAARIETLIDAALAAPCDEGGAP